MSNAAAISASLAHFFTLFFPSFLPALFLHSYAPPRKPEGGPQEVAPSSLSLGPLVRVGRVPATDGLLARPCKQTCKQLFRAGCKPREITASGAGPSLSSSLSLSLLVVHAPQKNCRSAVVSSQSRLPASSVWTMAGRGVWM